MKPKRYSVSYLKRARWQVCVRCGRKKLGVTPRPLCLKCYRPIFIKWAQQPHRKKPRCSHRPIYRELRCRACHRRFHRRREFIRRLAQVGLSITRYQAMVRSQSRRCLICKKVARLVPDHNHKTGQTRGLLCSVCNLAIGLFQDNSIWLNTAARYLSDSLGNMSSLTFPISPT